MPRGFRPSLALSCVHPLPDIQRPWRTGDGVVVGWAVGGALGDDFVGQLRTASGGDDVGVRVPGAERRRMTRAETRRRRESGAWYHRHRVTNRRCGSGVPTLPISCRSQRLWSSARDFCCMNAAYPIRVPGLRRVMEKGADGGGRAGRGSVAPAGAGCS
jgi:hypothetical protein